MPTTKTEPVPSLQEKLSPEEAVREVADYFDYAVVHQGKVYLLTKRYTNPEDLPEVTAEECRIGFRAIAKILTAFDPKFPNSSVGYPVKEDIVRMLSPEQMDRVGKSGLPVSELTPSQHAEMWRWALSFYLQVEMDKFARDYPRVENRNPADPVFHWVTVMDIQALGYDMRSEQLNRVMFIPVSEPNRISVAPDGTLSRISNYSIPKSATASHPDPTDPAHLSEQIKLFLDNKKSPHSQPISQVIAALNARAADHIVYKVNAAYAAKPILLVGTDTLPTDVVMRALASVYGLRMDRNTDGSLFLTTPVMFEATHLSDMGRALRSAVPAPIYHALQTRAFAKAKALVGGQISEGAMVVVASQYTMQGIELRRNALRVFRYLAEPQIKAQGGGKLALSSLAERARSMFELATTINFFANACWIADRPVPPYISDLDQTILSGGVTKENGAERLSIKLSYMDPKTGLLQDLILISNAPLPR